MPEKTGLSAAKSIDLEAFNKIHHANYGLFRAKTEDDIIDAVKAALRISPFVSGYYWARNEGLELAALLAPPRGRNLSGAPKKIALTPA